MSKACICAVLVGLLIVPACRHVPSVRAERQTQYDILRATCEQELGARESEVELRRFVIVVDMIEQLLARYPEVRHVNIVQGSVVLPFVTKCVREHLVLSSQDTNRAVEKAENAYWTIYVDTVSESPKGDRIKASASLYRPRSHESYIYVYELSRRHGRWCIASRRLRFAS